MKLLIAGLYFLAISVHCSGQEKSKNPFATEQEIIKLSKQKWLWMADKKADTLDGLFHEKSMFVHMGGIIS